MLSGPVGAGKSAVAQILLSNSFQKTAYIEGDVFWSFIPEASVGRRYEHFKTIMSAMTAAALPFALRGYEVVLDFTIPPWFLDTVRRIVDSRVRLYYIVLRPSEKVCAERAAKRAEGAIADYSPYHSLYEDFAKADRYVVEDDAADPAQLANLVRAGIEKMVFWLRDGA